MKVIGKIFAVLISIIYFFILTAFMIAAFSLNLLSGNYYSNVMKSIDLKSVKVSDLDSFFEEDNQFGKNATLEDVVVKYFTEGGVDKELAEAIVNNKKVREVAGKFIGEYINYNITGERPQISKDDIEDVFNEPDVKKLFEQSPEKIDLDVDLIYNQLNDLIDEMMEGESEGYGNSKQSENSIRPY